MIRKLLALFLAVVAVAFWNGNGTLASCGGTPPSISEQLGNARVVFVGTVLNTSDNNRTARVRVESIWKGPLLPMYVDVHGEAPGSGPFSGSEADHLYQPGQRYLFAPINTNTPFEDYGECGTLTQPYTADLATYAPADAHAPAPWTAMDEVRYAASQYWWTVLVILAIALVVAAPPVRRRVKRLARDARL